MNFDLNIANYKIKELEEFFELPINYDSEIIANRASKMHQNIANDHSVNELIKSNTIDFLIKAKNMLIHNLNNPNNQVKKVINTLKETYSNLYNTDKDLAASSIIDAGGTTIIERPIHPHVSSQPSEFFQGRINPLDKRIVRQFLNIDTRFRDNYCSTLSSNFHMDLPLRITNVVSMQLSALEFPESFYNISRVFGSNYFTVIRDDISAQIILPDGNYDTSVLCNYINDTLVGFGLPFSDIFFEVEIYNNNGTGKMIARLIDTPVSTNDFTLNFYYDALGNDPTGKPVRPCKQVDPPVIPGKPVRPCKPFPEKPVSTDACGIGVPLQLKLGWKMGFREGVYENANYYKSEGLVDLTGSKYLFLVINDYNRNVNDGFYSAFNSSILNTNILARISLQTPPFSNSIQNNLGLITYPRQYFGQVDIQKLQVQLLDEYGRVIDLNYMDYSFCLTMQTTYDM